MFKACIKDVKII